MTAPTVPTTETLPVVVEPSLTQPVSLPTNEAAVIAAQQAVIQDNIRERRELMERLAKIEAQQIATPPLSPEVSSQQFFANPQEMIGREIANQLKPLNDFRIQMVRDTKYQTLKQQMKRDSRFVALENAQVESALDNLVAEHEEFNLNAIVRDYYTALGTVAASGGLTPAIPNEPTPPAPLTTTSVINPPHLRPSAPPARETISAAPKTRALTENERHLARVYGMTEEQYIADMGIGEAVTSELVLPTFQPPKEGK